MRLSIFEQWLDGGPPCHAARAGFEFAKDLAHRWGQEGAPFGPGPSVRAFQCGAAALAAPAALCSGATLEKGV